MEGARQEGPGRDLPADDVLGPDLREPGGREPRLGDFTTDRSVLRLVPLALAIGVVSAFAALALLDLIALITNLAYGGRVGLGPASPAAFRPGPVHALLPVLGGLVVGAMARYGSERIRGHGIPEAMETILVGGSKVEPRLAVLKPVSSAISIGTGGPFGAEGPIILTGGAFGSIVAQSFHLSAIERRSLLVAGAAGGMSAVFGTPVAAVLLAVELLLFELKPRSLVLVGLAATVAEALRGSFAHAGWIAPEPLFPAPRHGPLGPSALLGALALGLVAGATAWVMTRAVYGAEDAFRRLPLHWVWWPAIGGVVVGVGGLLQPRVLGVGYETIGAALLGRLALGTLATVAAVKLVVWAIALGSGTSGGILAPILMIGACVGGLVSPALPAAPPGTWARVGMAAAMAGVTRSPLTAVVFALELTHDVGLVLPLLLASVTAHLVSVLSLRRSILTEKVARRGFHVLREYAVNPLEVLFVRDVMATDVVTVEPDRPLSEVYEALRAHRAVRRQRLLPVVREGRLVGVVPWVEVLQRAADGDLGGTIDRLARRDAVVAHPDETLREVADRMASRGLAALPVVERARPEHLRGIVVHHHLLRARDRMLQEERHRERVLHPLPLWVRWNGRRRRAPEPVDRPEHRG
ncbi:MAG TPA: chloride channel protein [Actinomycetota bacterium]|nr:chloride channel protein [Actinomycetota bacterium]